MSHDDNEPVPMGGSGFRDVAQERSLRRALDEAEDLYNNAPCGYHSLDENGVFVRVNDTELRWLGRTRDEVVGKLRIQDLLGPESLAHFDEQFAGMKTSGLVENLEVELVRKDGTTLTGLLSATAVRDEHGRFVMTRTTLYDVSERKRANLELRRANRALRVLSSANSALIHAEDEARLLEAICRVCVELGGYTMAWVGFAMQDEARSVLPVAHSGTEAGYLERAGITWSDDPRGQGPTGTAIRTGKPQVNQNFLTNPRMAPWREDALRIGYQSSVALPLMDAGGPLGALMLYAPEADAFDEEELHLLGELAVDLAFGIVTLRAREQHRLVQEELAHLAYFDTLTDLPNRTRLMDALAQSASDAQAGKGTFALLSMDVVRFGEIQSAIGVRNADDLLRQIAARLSGALREGELLARTGDERFAILLRPGDAARARECAQRVETVLKQPFLEAGVPLDVEMHVGAALAPGHGLEPEALLLRSAIAARQGAKAGAAFALYEGLTESETPRLLVLISELRAAIKAKQLVLHYQPKVDLASGGICGVEALVRWPHPERGLVPPGEFIGIAEKSGLIKHLTLFVLDSAARQCHQWGRLGFEVPVAVNVSSLNVSDAEFVGQVEKTLCAWNVRPELLQVELTESTLMEDQSKTQQVLNRLGALGIRVSIDDFGTGYSSLSYVASLPIHALKIDRFFIVRMLESERIRTVIDATISLARTLGIRTVAEGVEEPEQVEALRAMGVDEIQGFFYSRPLEAEALRQWAAEFARR